MEFALRPAAQTGWGSTRHGLAHMVNKIEQDHQRFRQIVRGKIRKDLRSTTPEQRADRWRQAQRMPPAPPPGQTPPEAR